ncbi:hypothetical protein BLGI_3170 [Brevibacillus laterosporus GI-9]|nr:hypothetical protein BLGI_3170 [Brevibacillus laterosporus GI-9]
MSKNIKNGTIIPNFGTSNAGISRYRNVQVKGRGSNVSRRFEL